MLSKIKKSSSEGFTIIEVMIVLAIAALILLIVLLAVPALQRSSSNTSRKNDASAIAAALSNFINNNNGDMPSQVAAVNGNSNQLLVGSPQTTNTEQANLGYYKAGTSATLGSQSGSIYIQTVSSTVPTINATTTNGSISADSISTDDVSIVVGENCTTTAPGQGTLSTRDIAVWYVTDTGSGAGALQCATV